MQTPIISTAYCPSIIYFAFLAQTEEVLIEQFETFPKQTLRNRAIILTANGPLSLIVPVERPNGNHTLTKDINISYRENWHIQHWRAIESAYNTSPYFLYYKDGLEKIYKERPSSLIELNNKIIHYLAKKIKIECKTTLTEQFEPFKEQDLRTILTNKKEPFEIHFEEYNQVFNTKYPFVPNASILDLLFNMGPDTKKYLMEQKIDIIKR